MMTILRFHRPLIHHIRHNKSSLRVSKEELPTEIMTSLLENDGMILWENQGSFRLFTNATLQNTNINIETARSLTALYSRTSVSAELLDLLWQRGIIVDSRIAQAILSTSGDKRDEPSDSKTAAKTSNKDQANPQ